MKLFIAEEQGLLRDVYESFFSETPGFQVLGVSADVGAQSVTRAVNGLRPDVIVVGAKVIRGPLIDAIRRLHENSDGLTPVVLCSSYDLLGAQSVLDYLQRAPSGLAFVLKETVDSVEDLAGIIRVASAGHVVVDPGVVQDLIAVLDAYSGFLEDLPPQDLEVLELMSKGMSDGAIGRALGLPLAAVGRRIEAIYDKTGVRTGAHDPRVHVITMYLKAVGALPVRDFRFAESRSASPVDVQSWTDRPWAFPEAQGAPDDNDLEERLDVPRGRRSAAPAANGRPNVNDGHERSAAEDPREGAEPLAASEDPLDNALRRYGPDLLKEFERFTASARPADNETAARLLEWAARHDLRIKWGKAGKEVSFSLALDVNGIAFWLVTVWAIGGVEVQFQMLEAQRPFSDDDKREELAARLERVHGVSIPPEAMSGRLRVRLSALRQPEDFAQFIGTMDWVIETITQAWVPKD